MKSLSPGMIIGIGFVLVLFGAVTPFLMVMHILPSTFFLNFLAYAASLLGLILGFVGSLMYIRGRKNH
jgi:hypothetical protein